MNKCKRNKNNFKRYRRNNLKNIKINYKELQKYIKVNKIPIYNNWHILNNNSIVFFKKSIKTKRNFNKIIEKCIQKYNK